MDNGEKRYAPGANPEWGLELPDGDGNSLVAKDGRNWDNGYNFDERNNDSPYDILTKDHEFTEKVKDKAFYTGVFVDREELYDKFPAHLKNSVEKPHVTINFAPNETQLHLDELGDEVKVIAVGYGNDGKNEGLLVKVETDNPVLKKALETVEVPHITLSCSDDSHPMYTSRLDFSPLQTPVELTKNNKYCIHLKDGKDGVDGPLVSDINELKDFI